jgi:hypothetical protein
MRAAGAAQGSGLDGDRAAGGNGGAAARRHTRCAARIASMSKKGKPTVYLLHFERAIAHARHYMGWSCFVEARLADHAAGRGARLPQVFRERGISGRCVRQWKGGRDLERRLKRQKQGPKLCPVCRAADGKE